MNEFASPFKRRKALLAGYCAADTKAKAVANDPMSPPPAARKTLGRFFTPQGKGKGAPAAAGAAANGGPAAPATPGTERRQAKTEARPGAVIAAASPPSKKAAAAAAASPSKAATAGAGAELPLPPSLAALRDLLSALYATLPLVKARGQLTTLPNLRAPVANLGGRALRVEQLQQIKAIYPDAFTWRHVLVPVGRAGRTEEALMLGLTPAERVAEAEQELEQQQQDKQQQDKQQQQEQALAAATPARRSTRALSRQASAAAPATAPPAARAAPAAAASPAKRAASLPTPGRPAAVGCSASVSGTLAQQREFARRLQALLAERKGAGAAELTEADLKLAPLPAPAAPSVRDATPSRRNGSASGEPPRTPQSARAPPASGSPADPGTPATGATARALEFSPVAAAKQPVPRFPGTAPPAAGRGGGAAPATPGGTKRNALGLEIPRPSPSATGGLLSPGGRAGASGMRPSRLCFDSTAAAAAAAAAEEEAAAAAKAAGPRVRRLSFDPPAAAAAKGDQQQEQQQQPERQLSCEGSGASSGSGSGASAGRQLSGGLQFELKASTLALLERATSAQARVEQARAAAELSARHHLDRVPATFEVLKAIFGATKGPCALPRETVLSELRARSASKSGLSPADAAEQLQLVLRLLPGWIRVDHPPGVKLADMRVVVRIHRRTPWPELRRQLLERAAEARREAPPVAGADAEARAAAEAADLAAAALAAAERRAEAAVDALAGGSDEGCGGEGDADDDGSAAEAAAEAARCGAKGPVEPESLAACLKARIWGQQ